jgi:hypothetical protein
VGWPQGSTAGESADGRSMVYLGVGAYFHFNDLAAQTLSQERVLKWCLPTRAPAYNAHALRKTASAEGPRHF